MALLTAPFPHQDTSFVSQIQQSAAALRERQAEAAKNYALQIQENKRREVEAKERMEYERQRASELVNQFAIKHAFDVSKDIRDAKGDDLRNQKTTLDIEEKQRDAKIYTGEDLPPSEQIASSAAPAPGSPDFIGPVDPSAPPPPDPGILPPKNFVTPAKPTSYADSIANLKKGFVGMPEGMKNKAVADASVRMTVASTKAAGAGLQKIAPGVFQSKTGALYRWDESEGSAPVRIGVDASAKRGLIDPVSGEIWTMMTNGKWLGPGEVIKSSPPPNLVEIPGMFDKAKMDLAKGAQALRRDVFDAKQEGIAKTGEQKSALADWKGATNQADREIDELHKIRSEISKRKITPEDASRVSAQEAKVEAAGKAETTAREKYQSSLTAGEKKDDFSSAEAVRDAVKAGKLTREAAKAILTERFGFK